jgi:hypothetical protein
MLFSPPFTILLASLAPNGQAPLQLGIRLQRLADLEMRFYTRQPACCSAVAGLPKFSCLSL